MTIPSLVIKRVMHTPPEKSVESIQANDVAHEQLLEASHTPSSVPQQNQLSTHYQSELPMHSSVFIQFPQYTQSTGFHPPTTYPREEMKRRLQEMLPSVQISFVPCPTDNKPML